MPKKDIILTQSRLKELLTYNPLTGQFIRVIDRGLCRAGDIAGYDRQYRNHKRRIICVDYKEYPASRLAWLWMTGDLPSLQIDHIDQNTLNDRWENLRNVSNAENHKNERIRLNNKSGSLGIHWDAKRYKWFAQIRVNGSKIFLGRYITNIAATYARHCANDKYGYHANHGKSR